MNNKIVILVFLFSSTLAASNYLHTLTGQPEETEIMQSENPHETPTRPARYLRPKKRCQESRPNIHYKDLPETDFTRLRNQMISPPYQIAKCDASQSPPATNTNLTNNCPRKNTLVSLPRQEQAGHISELHKPESINPTEIILDLPLIPILNIKHSNTIQNNENFEEPPPPFNPTMLDTNTISNAVQNISISQATHSNNIQSSSPAHSSQQLKKGYNYFDDEPPKYASIDPATDILSIKTAIPTGPLTPTNLSRAEINETNNDFSLITEQMPTFLQLCKSNFPTNCKIKITEKMREILHLKAKKAYLAFVNAATFMLKCNELKLFEHLAEIITRKYKLIDAMQAKDFSDDEIKKVFFFIEILDYFIIKIKKNKLKRQDESQRYGYERSLSSLRVEFRTYNWHNNTGIYTISENEYFGFGYKFVSDKENF